MGKRTPVLDLEKPHTKIINNEPDLPKRFAAYKQNGIVFDQNMEPLDEYHEAHSNAAKREKAVQKAQNILGDLGELNPINDQREAAKENANAAAAEALSDDA